MPRYYDFFAGAGLVALGLGPEWECIWANDIDETKYKVYAANFGNAHFLRGDVADIDSTQLPTPADMAWASFPCQDLSLAGWRRGISADRSGTFWAFWRLMRNQLRERHRPPVIVIENVAGLLYGDSFAGLCEALAGLEMQFGALVIDAKHFLPQSRPRVFVTCVDSGIDCSSFTAPSPNPLWSPKSLMAAHARLDDGLRRLWRWWKLPAPGLERPPIDSLIEHDPEDVQWHSPEGTRRLLAMMNATNKAKISAATRDGGRHIGFLYKRMRSGVQRAEVRFDGTSGCLRTPRGGSSRQTVVVVEHGGVRSRLLSPREAARLMGADDSFILPARYNDAYKAMGDGVAAPVVRWLSEQLLLPLSQIIRSRSRVVDKQARLEPARGREYQESSNRRADEWLTLTRSRRVSSLG